MSYINGANIKVQIIQNGNTYEENTYIPEFENLGDELQRMGKIIKQKIIENGNYILDNNKT